MADILFYIFPTSVIVAEVCGYAPSWRIVHVDWGNNSVTGRNDAMEFQWIFNGIKTIKQKIDVCDWEKQAIHHMKTLSIPL